MECLRRYDILDRTLVKGIVSMNGVTRPGIIVADINLNLDALETYLIQELSTRKAPTYEELRIRFLTQRY